MPEGLCSVTTKEDVMLILKLITTDMAIDMEVQTSFRKSGFSGKVIMVQNPYKGFNLIRNFKLPDPAIGGVGSVRSLF